MKGLLAAHRWMVEWRLLCRSASVLWIAASLVVLTAVALFAGYKEIERQNLRIHEAKQLHETDVAATARWISKEQDAGNAAYYTAHLTWDSPSPLAFAALGMRDSAPWLLRVRALGLEAQLYENDIGNAELMRLGKLDYAFVLVWLMPLLVIALFHDVISGEKSAGRLMLLTTTAASRAMLWVPRLTLRAAVLILALLVPLGTAGFLLEVPAGMLLPLMVASGTYALFWIAVCVVVSSRSGGTTAHAGTLAAVWFCLTLVFPAIGQLLISQRYPAPQGLELTLSHRDKVHAAWEIPREDTMKAFFRSHPEWRSTSPVTTPFHWKWYLAFHQVADESVAPEVALYRQALLQRQRATDRLGWLLPPVALQNHVNALATTDLPAHLRYLDRIRVFHAELRKFYYPYLFNERPFGLEDFQRAPKFRSEAAGVSQLD